MDYHFVIHVLHVALSVAILAPVQRQTAVTTHLVKTELRLEMDFVLFCLVTKCPDSIVFRFREKRVSNLH